MKRTLLAAAIAATAIFVTSAKAELVEETNLKGMAMCQAVALTEAIDYQAAGNETMWKHSMNRLYMIGVVARRVLKRDHGTTISEMTWDTMWADPALKRYNSLTKVEKFNQAQTCMLMFSRADMKCDDGTCPMKYD